jgi:hypothetical protein
VVLKGCFLGKVCNVLDLSFYPKTSIIDQKKPKMSQNRSKLVKNNQKRTILNLPIPCI